MHLHVGVCVYHPLKACGWLEVTFSEPSAMPPTSSGAHMADWQVSLRPRQSSNSAPLHCHPCRTIRCQKAASKRGSDMCIHAVLHSACSGRHRQQERP